MRFLTLTLALAASAAPLAAQRAMAPSPGTPKSFRLAASRSFALPNGLEVTLVPFGTIPKAHVRLVVRSGNLNEKASEVWLADVTGAMLSEGTTTKSAAQLAEAFAAMGGEFEVGVGVDVTSLYTEVLGERAPDAIRLVAEVAQRPAMPASELGRIKADKLRDVAIQKSQPQPVAQEAFAKALYGDHPYGRVFPTEAQLQGYTIEQVRGFWDANAGAARSHLYVTGVFDQKAVEQAIRDAFQGWKRGPAPLQLPPTPSTKRTISLLDRPKAPQSTIYMGLPVADPTSKDWIGLRVTDALLGGSFGSRITSNIREQKGYTYSPYSYVSSHVKDAYWNEVADVTTEHTGASITEILREIERLQKEAPSSAELKGIQNYLAGIFTIQNSSRAGIASQLQFANLHGLGASYLTSYVDNVMKVTPNEVQSLAQRYIDPNRMTIVVVGDKATVEQQLQPFQGVVP